MDTLKQDIKTLREIFDEDTLLAIEIGAPILFKPGEDKVIRRALSRLEAYLEKASAGGRATKGIRKPRLPESELTPQGRYARRRRAKGVKP